ncbi:MAG: TIGR03557 family F420-dependent LLM class oxidoreductase [Candidatus Dormibacteraeota bacterium]|nr:TIGR03557 family F420-dependent LLM class oxidoreductase [Candidatus Dormibacteraeota bacterium]MBO0761639.1 TIGR03557 family F420-dependent LLM class oxidoreductase [Candidatus Dormibacteraeota bacterium]
MMKLGYTLSSEEHAPNALVDQARRAEDIGFEFALISDHYHPWISAQGQSPFVWTVLGGIARETKTLRVGTGVTCPLVRVHPAIVAHASATAATMFGSRFFLGVGTGERLNEHVLGDRWPPAPERLDMLAEAIDLIKKLWGGAEVTEDGAYYSVEQARLFTLPEQPPEILAAAGGDRAARLAASMTDGLIAVGSSADVVQAFEAAGGQGRPRYGQLHCCWAPSEEEAVETALRVWPTNAVPGVLNAELATPAQFEAATSIVTPDMLRRQMPLGPEPRPFLERIQSFADAGFDHVYLHQIGPDQEGFFRFCERELLPEAPPTRSRNA